MSNDNEEKVEKNKHTIEIKIPFNGVISGASSDIGKSDMDSKANDDSSRKEQKDEPDESNTSKKNK